MLTRAIHLVTTTYGTWLPGDQRGHWSHLLDFYGHLREGGHRLRIGDEATHAVATRLMDEPERILTPAELQTVAQALGGIMTTPYHPPATPTEVFRPPVVHAASIERTHMHLLIGTLREEVGQFMGRLKGMSSSAVGAMPGNENRRHVWTAGYWCVFLFDDRGVDAVQQYIEKHNLRKNLPSAPFDWVHPRRIRRR